jgi:HPr kinase/phosphorylase
MYLTQDSETGRASVHGVLVDVRGVGILITGKSGIGKSECALDLVLRGHKLVSDDVVTIIKSGGRLEGSGPAEIRHHMEIQGLGIIDVGVLFGAASVRDSKWLDLVIELVEWSADGRYDRLGIDDPKREILGIAVPLLVVPVRPGRNVATIMEVAARNHMLKLAGINSAREFQRRLTDQIERAKPSNGGDGGAG